HRTTRLRFTCGSVSVPLFCPHPEIRLMVSDGDDLARIRRMLRRLTKRLRLRAALMLTLAYALCVVAPALALAFSDGAVAAHCLTEDHGFFHAPGLHVHEQTHVHSHAAADIHADAAVPATHDETKHHSGTCCGLFCHAA